MFTNKELRKLFLPLVLEQMLAIAVGLVDTVMVSSVGEAAVSGVSLVDMINQLMINIFAALATGGAVVAAQYIGHKEKEKACESANHLFIASVVCSAIIAGLCMLFHEGVLRLFLGTIENSVMNNAKIYFVISAISYPFLAVYNSGAALFRVMGRSNITLKLSFIMNVFNIAFNAIFIFEMKLGAAGAAWGSLMARAVAAVIICMLLRNPELSVHFLKFGKHLFQKDMMKRILRIGIPNGFENGVFQMGRIFVVSIISGFGTVQIAANAVANNLDAVGVIPGEALSLAMIIVVGRCVGAKDFEQAEYYAKKIIKISYVVLFLLNGTMLLMLPEILQIYSLTPEALKLASSLIMIHNGCGMILWTPAFVLPNALRAAGDVKFTMRVSSFSMLVFRILLSFVLGKEMGLGAIGVWLAMIIDWLFRDALFIWRFLQRKWQQNTVI